MVLTSAPLFLVVALYWVQPGDLWILHPVVPSPMSKPILPMHRHSHFLDSGVTSIEVMGKVSINLFAFSKYKTILSP